MSLLLDARKKSQQANSAQSGGTGSSGLELSLEPHPDSVSQPADPATAPSPDDRARVAGQNLFNAKSNSASLIRPGINRNLLLALGGVVILVAAGAGYVWYTISAGNAQRPAFKPAVASREKPVAAAAQPQNNLVPEIAPAAITPSRPARIPKPRHTVRRSAKTAVSKENSNNPVIIQQHQEESIDPILNDAYLAYRSGELDRSQQLYRRALSLDSRNSDALLGLAAIAQRRGEDNQAAHYYALVMALDPRNAVANAGMSALTNDDNRESRLKTLLNEQPDSASLHFALGNYYAGQARWADAQQAYFNAYKVAPDDAELAFNLAVSLDRLGQSKSAAQYYQRALQLDTVHHAGFDHASISQRIKELTH